MHEYSIVDSLLQLAEEHAIKNNAKKVTKLEIKIGVLSGVEPDLLKTAFDTFKEGTMCEEAEFIMKIQPVVVRCEKCGFEGELSKDEYLCPQCQSGNIKIIDGEDMYLMSLELETDD
ncbi:hydrogenase maturation nickel metallochaperone HypA [Caminibacter pacificus]|uniref:Hydrogenase maturation factor HypA n=1 Tax=Caminibacter pacificus TaxID=1424653 RepID=A0AAJ4RDG8_9BACT|nr:hydrogenase maturation nickel metallochaperone HypA [Caminibacter pacificus]QCI28650.1 hydrogenase maturation nickel metallochaperone HypA [Caminibacter pacificus]ROR40621.1 hydrogenase-3 nickel incorporation protein HypA [Caminibacter pacificus]